MVRDESSCSRVICIQRARTNTVAVTQAVAKPSSLQAQLPPR